MREKLTPQEAALYIGQQIVFSLNAITNDHKGKLIGLSVESGCLTVEVKREDGTIFLSTIKQDSAKLLLRPLSDITEEESKQLYGYMSLRPTVREMAKYTNLLREFGIDCDGLIESGKALDKTKTGKEPQP